jgi:uncharacterized membrane protein
MTQTSYDGLVASYLDELTEALAGLPRARRSELLDDIADHIDALLAEAAARGPVTRETVEEVLAEVGEPAAIARAAGAETLPVQGATGWDKAIIAFLLVGGIIVPGLGWLIGVVMLWVSSSWRVKDKVIGTLLVPGGLLLPLVLLVIGVAGPASTTSCTQSPTIIATPASGGPATVESTAGTVHCTGGTSIAVTVVFAVLFAFSVVGPFVGATWLTRHARHDDAELA